MKRSALDTWADPDNELGDPAYPGAIFDTVEATKIRAESRNLDEKDHKGFDLSLIDRDDMNWHPTKSFADLRDSAKKAIDKRDPEELLRSMFNRDALAFVVENWAVLWRRGMFEEALIIAHQASGENNCYIDFDWQRSMWKMADPAKLLDLCDPLPGNGPFTLYRGVLGFTRKHRRIRALSWTDDFERALFFAEWSSSWETDPALNRAVYKTTVEKSDVFAYLHEGFRNEAEFVVHIRPHHKIRKVWPNFETHRTMTYADFRSKEEFMEAVVNFAKPFIAMADFDFNAKWKKKESALYEWMTKSVFDPVDTTEGILAEFNISYLSYETPETS